MSNDIALFWWCSSHGHVLNNPTSFCPKHGSGTITNCLTDDCQLPLSGDRVEYCPSCGTRMPWNKPPAQDSWGFGWRKW